MPYRNYATVAMLVLAASGSHAEIIKVTTGKDCAASGYAPLTEAECKAEEAKGDGQKMPRLTSPALPPGCSWRILQGGEKPFYNHYAVSGGACGVTLGGSAVFPCLCKGSEPTTTEAPTTTTTTTTTTDAPDDPASEHEEKQNEYTDAQEDTKLAALQAKCDACKAAEDGLIELLKRAVTEHGDAQKKKDLMDAAEKAMNEAKAAFDTAKAAYDAPKTTAEETDGAIETATATRDAKCGASVE